MPHLIDLIKKHFSDSKIASNLKMKSTKASAVIKNAIAPVCHSKVVQHLKSNFFSLIIDESTDISVTKSMAICVRTLYNGEIKSLFYRLVEVNGSTAKELSDSILAQLALDDIPLSNITGIT
jgi:hypothetical protein